jgi:hypothetical protein
VTDSGVPADVKASLLRRRAATQPIWIDVSGMSMGQRLPGGARVLVAAGLNPRRGEVWAFVDDDGHVVVHRLKRHAAGRSWLQGDANPSSDAPVPADRLIGRVTSVDMNGRTRSLGVAERWRGRLLLEARGLRGLWTSVSRTVRSRC